MRLVYLSQKGNPITDTNVLSCHFRKLSRNIIRDIEALKNTEEFNNMFFKMLNFYIMTKQGFMLLAKNYNAKKYNQVMHAFLEYEYQDKNIKIKEEEWQDVKFSNKPYNDFNIEDAEVYNTPDAIDTLEKKDEIATIKTTEVLGKPLSVYGTPDEPLFLAKDVAEWIDYAKTSQGYYNVSMMLKSVDEDEKLTINILYSDGKAHNQLFLTENGLYEVLMLSRKPIAKEFKKAIKKILHEIRTKGQFHVPQTFKEALMLAAQQQEQIEKLEAQHKIEKPKADYYDDVLSSTSTYTTTQIAKEFGMSAIQLNDILYANAIQFRSNNSWIPYAKYQDKGYTKSETIVVKNKGEVKKTVMSYRWTEKGREFIHNFMKQYNENRNISNKQQAI